MKVKFTAILASLLTILLMVCPCLAASCAVACDLASLHSASLTTPCPMHGMDAAPFSSTVVHGHACANLCAQQPVCADLSDPAHDLNGGPAVLACVYLLPSPALSHAFSPATQNATRSGSPPLLSPLRL